MSKPLPPPMTGTIYDCLCPCSPDGNHKWKRLDDVTDRCRMCAHRRSRRRAEKGKP